MAESTIPRTVPDQCPECHATLWVSPRGAFCPKGHGKIIPLTPNEHRQRPPSVWLAEDVTPCETCGGTGKVDCPECGGSGISECPCCLQEVNCLECNGHGDVDCADCHGMGFVVG